MSTILKETFLREKLLYNYSLRLSSEASKSQILDNNEVVDRSSLSEEQIAEGLSNFGKNAIGDNYAFLFLNLSNKNLNTIQGVQSFIYIQNVDVSNNNLKSIKPLGHLKYMIKLNASHNQLKTLFEFKGQYCLQEVDMSYNLIDEIKHVSDHKYITDLNLENNLIGQIKELSQNSNLKCLNLNHNEICQIENLDGLPLIELNLSGNKIKEISGLDKLQRLRTLDLSRNTIKKLSSLQELTLLKNLLLTDNQIKNVRELKYLEHFSELSVLDMCHNPIQQRRYYRLQVLFRLPQIKTLDGVETTAKELEQSECLFGLDVEQRKVKFHSILPDEEFVDRRIHTADFIDPETESENDDNVQIIDKYDNKGNLIMKVGSRQQSRTESRTGQNSVKNLSLNNSRKNFHNDHVNIQDSLEQ